MQRTKKGLGRGLDALIGSSITKQSIDENDLKSGVMELDINKIEPNINQPRKIFNEESLNELAESIKNFGIIQPLIVKEDGGFYSIIAGERRWRAARIARLSTIPVIIKEYNEIDTIQIALIENIQREDLNPIEEAECYKRLQEDYFFSQEDIANKVGKKRNVVSYYLSLLNLDKRVKQLIADGKLTAGHGRILLTINDCEKQFLASEHAIENCLTVRELEDYINNHIDDEIFNNEEETEVSVLNKKKIPNITYRGLETDLKNILGTKVKIKNGKKKGKIEIEYYSEDELDRLVGMFKNII